MSDAVIFCKYQLISVSKGFISLVKPSNLFINKIHSILAGSLHWGKKKTAKPPLVISSINTLSPHLLTVMFVVYKFVSQHYWLTDRKRNCATRTALYSDYLTESRPELAIIEETPNLLHNR